MTQNALAYDCDFSLLPGRELTALRGIATKCYDLGKGRRQAISYGEPVHFLCDGSLKDIDNRLVLDEKENTYRTTANTYKTELAYKDEGKELVTLTRDGVRFGFSYIGDANGAAGEVLPAEEKPEKRTEQDRRADLSDTLHSGVKYTNLRPGMDVVIHIDGRGIKDDIVIKESTAAEYAGIVLPKGFEYKRQADGSLLVYMDGKDYIRILAPTAMDADGQEVPVKRGNAEARRRRTRKQNKCAPVQERKSYILSLS